MQRTLGLICAFALILTLALSPPALATGDAALDVIMSYSVYIDSAHTIRFSALERLSEGLLADTVDYNELISVCERAESGIRAALWELPSYDVSALPSNNAALVNEYERLHGADYSLDLSWLYSLNEALARARDGASAHTCALAVGRELRVHSIELCARVIATNEELTRLDLPQAALDKWFSDEFLKLPAFSPYSMPYEADANELLEREYALLDEWDRVAFGGEFELDAGAFAQALDALYAYPPGGLCDADALLALNYYLEAVDGADIAELPPPDASEDGACRALLDASAPALNASNRAFICLLDADAALEAYLAAPTRLNRLRALGICCAADMFLAEGLAGAEALPSAVNQRLGELGIRADYHYIFYELSDSLAQSARGHIKECAALIESGADMALLGAYTETLGDMLMSAYYDCLSARDELFALLPTADRYGGWDMYYGELSMFYIFD